MSRGAEGRKRVKRGERRKGDEGKGNRGKEGGKGKSRLLTGRCDHAEMIIAANERE